MSEWWLSRGDGKTEGPLSTQVLVQGLVSGQVPKRAHVCRVGEQTWVRISQIDEIWEAANPEQIRTNITEQPWFLSNADSGHHRLADAEGEDERTQVLTPLPVITAGNEKHPFVTPLPRPKNPQDLRGTRPGPIPQTSSTAAREARPEDVPPPVGAIRAKVPTLDGISDVIANVGTAPGQPAPLPGTRAKPPMPTSTVTTPVPVAAPPSPLTRGVPVASGHGLDPLANGPSVDPSRTAQFLTPLTSAGPTRGVPGLSPLGVAPLGVAPLGAAQLASTGAGAGPGKPIAGIGSLQSPPKPMATPPATAQAPLGAEPQPPKAAPLAPGGHSGVLPPVPQLDALAAAGIATEQQSNTGAATSSQAIAGAAAVAQPAKPRFPAPPLAVPPAPPQANAGSQLASLLQTRPLNFSSPPPGPALGPRVATVPFASDTNVAGAAAPLLTPSARNATPPSGNSKFESTEEDNELTTIAYRGVVPPPEDRAEDGPEDELTTIARPSQPRGTVGTAAKASRPNARALESATDDEPTTIVKPDALPGRHEAPDVPASGDDDPTILIRPRVPERPHRRQPDPRAPAFARSHPLHTRELEPTLPQGTTTPTKVPGGASAEVAPADSLLSDPSELLEECDDESPSVEKPAVPVVVRPNAEIRMATPNPATRIAISPPSTPPLARRPRLPSAPSIVLQPEPIVHQEETQPAVRALRRSGVSRLSLGTTLAIVLAVLLVLLLVAFFVMGKS